MIYDLGGAVTSKQKIINRKSNIINACYLARNSSTGTLMLC